jgi:O-antigen ligase
LLKPVNLFRFLGESVSLIFIALFRKFQAFFKNKPALILSSLFLLHIIGLIYTTDFDYAIKDLRTKVPLFILPLFISTGPKIETKIFYWIIFCFIAAVFGGSIYRLILYINLPVADSRALSAHTSHIRFSLNAVFAVYSALFFIQLKDFLSIRYKLVLLAFSIWTMAFLVFMSYSTGIILLIVIGFLILLYKTLKIKSLSLKAGILSGGFLLLFLPIFVFLINNKQSSVPKVEFSKLENKTINGNTYYHDTVNFKARNGIWTGLYICDKELRQSWAVRSEYPIDSLDGQKQILRFTLIRYLASKGARKDSVGVFQLSEKEIKDIESGINDISPKANSISTQIEDFIAGYKRYVKYDDPNSGSLIQRFEYWKTSFLIIKEHPVFGVGTGDIPAAFEEQYTKMNSKLSIQNRLRSHNQYLSITIAFGIIGLLWFLLILIYPGIITKGFNNYFFVVFWLIFMLSMLTEDTIESQEGVTFYILFTALILLVRLTNEPAEDLFTSNKV